jgi:hypothetical protein
LIVSRSRTANNGRKAGFRGGARGYSVCATVVIDLPVVVVDIGDVQPMSDCTCSAGQLGGELELKLKLLTGCQESGGKRLGWFSGREAEAMRCDAKAEDHKADE